jgi:hypothetical protein
MNIKTLTIVALSLGLGGLCFGQTSSPTSGSKTSAASASPTSATSTSTMSTTTPAASMGAPYTEGGVWEVTMVKTKTGMSDDYLKQLGGALKPIYEEEKKQKLILDYKILLGEASSRHDFDILIMVEYPNMAAFDGLREKTEPIMSKVMGGEDQRRQLAVKRLDVREILGAKTMREITLK